jgi:Tfp pilus assembly protein PilX
MKTLVRKQGYCTKFLPHNEAGFTLPTVLSFIVAMTIITSTAMMVVMSNLTSSGTIIGRQQALHIAEAGVNYYLWHMAHNAGDYKDGNTTPATPDANLGYGPYAHDYVDANTQKKRYIYDMD